MIGDYEQWPTVYTREKKLSVILRVRREYKERKKKQTNKKQNENGSFYVFLLWSRLVLNIKLVG